jgi:hypothetical protein
VPERFVRRCDKRLFNGFIIGSAKMRRSLIIRRCTNLALVPKEVEKRKCSLQALKNAWIASNANDLIMQGEIEEAIALIANMTGDELAAAAQVMKDEAVLLQQFRSIADRYYSRMDGNLEELLACAAAAGDVEAKILLDTGVLDDKKTKSNRAA